MQKVSLTILIIFLLCTTLFSCVFSYPIFSGTTNLTRQNAFEINTYHETELYPEIKDEQKLLDLEWNDISAILPFNEPFELLLPNHDTSIFTVRTGGTSHADVEPATIEDFIKISTTITTNHPWQLTPAIVKLNNDCFLPACLATYAHGYKTSDLPTNGHYCLHFKNSKMHSSKKQDEKFQAVVNLAKTLARKALKQQDF